jgi:hypothetical protein
LPEENDNLSEGGIPWLLAIKQPPQDSLWFPTLARRVEFAGVVVRSTELEISSHK